MAQNIATSNQALRVEIITPQSMAYSETADMVVVPGVEGEFGVMFGHEKMVAITSIGTVRIHNGEQVTRWIVSDGMAEVKGDACVLLVEKAAALDEIEGAVMRGELDSVNTLLASTENEGEKLRLTKQKAYLEEVVRLTEK
jgi:F-type H+-transporting ATPase subunit epsilon